MPVIRDRPLRFRCRTISTTLVALLVYAAPAVADPITFAVRADTFVQTITLAGGALPPEIDMDAEQVDEQFGFDDLALISSSLTGSGATAGYSGMASARVIDGVLGAFATATFAGSDPTSITSQGYAGFIDYFTVNLPAGGFVTMSFTLVPTYTIQNDGGCTSIQASVEVPGDSLRYFDASCDADLLVTTANFRVPTGEPFRVLYELSAVARGPNGATGTATANALSSLQLLANPVGDFTYSTASTLNFQSTEPVPEPASLVLMGTGLIAVALRCRRRRPVR